MTERRITIQAEAYVMPDGLAARLGEEGSAARQRESAASAPPVPQRLRAQTVLEAMYEGGRLRKRQFDAGKDIVAYWAHWEPRFFAQSLKSGMVRSPGAPVPDPSGHMDRAERYKRWATEAEQRQVRGELTALQVTFDLCVRDMSPRALRKLYSISDARAARIVQVELLRYAQLAGWRDTQHDAA